MISHARIHAKHRRASQVITVACETEQRTPNPKERKSECTHFGRGRRGQGLRDSTSRIYIMCSVVMWCDVRMVAQHFRADALRPYSMYRIYIIQTDWLTLKYLPGRIARARDFVVFASTGGIVVSLSYALSLSVIFLCVGCLDIK